MQPLINEKGSKNAQDLAKLAESSGLKTKFNDDPKTSIEVFETYKNFDFLNPIENDKNLDVFAKLIRICVHFEIETMAFMQVMGFDVSTAYKTTVKNFMFKTTIDEYKDQFLKKEITEETFENFAKEISEDVYNYIKPQLSLPDIDWN